MFVTAAIFTSVNLVIEITDAGTHGIKIVNLCRFCVQDSVFKTRLQDLKKNSSVNSNDMVPILKTTAILFIPLMFA